MRFWQPRAAAASVKRVIGCSGRGLSTEEKTQSLLKGFNYSLRSQPTSPDSAARGIEIERNKNHEHKNGRHPPNGFDSGWFG